MVGTQIKGFQRSPARNLEQDGVVRQIVRNEEAVATRIGNHGNPGRVRNRIAWRQLEESLRYALS